ncbi:MAG: uracil phosphoribosyltransferase [Gemmatimonadales bacterium]|jgi:uracil phosphoribosyltransferase|nr:uracil phosphoribosyltransferase [Gemmatimonadales bacterium]
MGTHPDFPNLTVLDHPLIQHKVSLLRDRHTTSRDFKALVSELAMLMGYEVTRDLPLEPVEIETPLERMTGRQVQGKRVIVVPILRAGLGMVDGLIQLLPSARVGHIGLVRDEATHAARRYYFKLPSLEEARDFLVLDPMLATGGSAVKATAALKDAGATRIRFLALVAAPDGVRAMLAAHPDVPVYVAALDRGLDAHAYIVPGLGDAGDRLFGTL